MLFMSCYSRSLPLIAKVYRLSENRPIEEDITVQVMCDKYPECDKYNDRSSVVVHIYV